MGGVLRKDSHSIIASSVATPMTNITRSSRMVIGFNVIIFFRVMERVILQTMSMLQIQTLNMERINTKQLVLIVGKLHLIFLGLIFLDLYKLECLKGKNINSSYIIFREGKRVNVNPKMSRR